MCSLCSQHTTVHALSHLLYPHRALFVVTPLLPRLLRRIWIYTTTRRCYRTMTRITIIAIALKQVYLGAMKLSLHSGPIFRILSRNRSCRARSLRHPSSVLSLNQTGVNLVNSPKSLHLKEPSSSTSILPSLRNGRGFLDSYSTCLLP